MAGLRHTSRPDTARAVACLVAGLLVSAAAPAARSESRPAAPAVQTAREADTLAVAIGEAPSRADSPSTSAGQAESVTPKRPRRIFSFTPRRYDQCELFLATEASGARVAITTIDPMDEYLFANGIALMKNIDPRWSVGGGVDVHLARGIFKVAPDVRCRRWFAREQSIEASLGYVTSPPRNEPGGNAIDLVGPIVSARYYPARWFFVQGGVCRFRERRSSYHAETQSLTYSTRDFSKAFGGIGLSGGGGATLWGIEALTVGVLMALLAGMES